MIIVPDQGDLTTTQQTYSYLLLDSRISASNAAIVTYPTENRDTTGITQITLDNVNFLGDGAAIKDTSGNIILAGGQKVTSWALGSEITTASTSGHAISGVNLSPTRKPSPGLLGADGGYFERTKPQYENILYFFFKNALDHGCKGDGKTDDTACLNDLFSNSGYYFLPAGVYLVTDTIKIHHNTFIIGEAWSQIMASGEKFSDMNNPRVLVQVGQPGDVGKVEMQDLMFTVQGNTAGAILVEWNIKASSPGDAAMWGEYRIPFPFILRLTVNLAP